MMPASDQNWYKVEQGDVTEKISGTIAEPNNNFNVTYTNTVKEEFYIYHSGVAVDGNLETIPMSAVETDGTYNLVVKTTANTLYGGYYLDYKGKGNYADDGVKADGGAAYDGYTQKWSDPETVDGTNMHPVAGETYYIKEVPKSYLKPAHIYTYQQYDKYLRDFILLSTTDDQLYQETGFMIGTKYTKSEFWTEKLTIHFGPNYDHTVKEGEYEVNVTNASTNSAGLVFSYRKFNLKNEAEKDYTEIIGSTSFKPYWITPDGITVTGAAIRRETVKDKDGDKVITINSGEITFRDLATAIKALKR
jgi:hypothetical protein